MSYKLLTLFLFVTLVYSNTVKKENMEHKDLPIATFLAYINKERSAVIFTEVPNILKNNNTFTHNILASFKEAKTNYYMMECTGVNMNGLCFSFLTAESRRNFPL